MGKKRKKKSSIRKIKHLISRVLLVGLVFGGYYLYKNPQLVSQILNKQPPEELVSSQAILNNFISQEKASEILGKTTSLVAEGLENIKIPKQLSGSNEEIVIQDAFDQFSQKIKDLPAEQVDRVKIQLCKDILEPIENVSVEIKE